MRHKRAAMVSAAVVLAWWWMRGPVGEPMDVSATVTSVKGSLPLKVDQSCRVSVTPESRGGYPCRVSLVCGEHSIYGGKKLGGYARCEVADGKYTHAKDEDLSSRDGDPWMDLDVGHRRLTVRDDRHWPGEVVVTLNL